VSFGTELLFVVALGLVVLETLRRSLGHTKMSATLEIYTPPVAQAQEIIVLISGPRAQTERSTSRSPSGVSKSCGTRSRAVRCSLHSRRYPVATG